MKMLLIGLLTLSIIGTLQTSDYEIKANYKVENNWIKLPKTGSLNIELNTSKEIKKVCFWIMPMGTSTWKYRTLLKMDDNGIDGWKLEWPFSNKIIYDHIVIEISNTAGETDWLILNVSNQ